jgi:OOP family OmpA-OmpF porin
MRLLREFNKLFIVIFLLGLSCQTYAENNTLTNLYFSAETGWSAMAHGHVSPYQFKDQKNFGYRLSMGYLFLLSNKFELGPEVGYGYYGKISYANPTNLVVYYESYGWSALANLTYEVTPKIDLTLKGGVTEVSQHYDIAGPGVTTGGFYQRAFSPTLIVATSYSLSQHTSIDLSYTHIFANSAPLTSDPHFTFTNVNQICSVNAVMAGITYSV